MNWIRKIKIDYWLALVFGVPLIWLTVPIDWTSDHGDGVMHYLFAKSAMKAPWHLMNLWAKPFFTLVSIPFAQFGFQGMHFMNCLCVIGSALLCSATARRLNLKYGWMCFFFIVPIPVLYGQVYAAMTEPFFAFWFALVLFLFSDKRYATAAFCASLLPFARQEGYLLIPVMILVYVWIGQYKKIPLLFSASLFLSILGYVFYGDLFYLVNSDPYKGSAYGSGPFMSFFSKAEVMFGFAVEGLIVLGLLYLIFYSMIKVFKLKSFIQFREDSILYNEFLLVAVYTFGFFLAHTIMWWLGICNSLGLERVIACVVPGAALIALRGLNVLITAAEKLIWKKVSYVLVPVFAILTIYTLGSRNSFPPWHWTNPHENVLIEASKWFKPLREKEKKLYFSHPFNIILYDINPKLQEDSDELMYTGGPNGIKEDSYVIWDTDFGPGNGFAKETLANDSSFVLMNSFKSEDFEALFYYKKPSANTKAAQQ